MSCIKILPVYCAIQYLLIMPLAALWAEISTYNDFAHCAGVNLRLWRPLFVQNKRKDNIEQRQSAAFRAHYLPLSFTLSAFSVKSLVFVKLSPEYTNDCFTVNTGPHTCIHTETVCICHTVSWPVMSKPPQSFNPLHCNDFTSHS